MTIARRPLGYLGVERDEERSVTLMTAHSFFMGLATVFFETAASATFLARFASSYLPWVYIAAAAVNTLTGTLYARAQARTSFATLMKGTLWFLLSLVVAVRLGFAVSGVAWVAFAGLVSYRIVSSLTDLEYWAVASRIYDVRQAKRLFGLIGTGEVVARIAGAFAVPLLVKVGGVSNLVLLSAAALALCLAIVRVVLAERDVAATSLANVAPREEPHGLVEGLRAIFSNRYLGVVVAVAILATFGKYFVDFAFLEQMSTQATGEEELAALLGLFSGLTQTLSLLTRLFISRPLLHRFGIRVGVMILPVVHALCAAATIAFGFFGGGSVEVFWLVVANQGLYKTFKHPIDNASFKVLYQPLNPKQRLGAQIAVEIIFSPIIVGLAGGVMLLFSAWMTYDPVRFSFVLLANFVAWALAARLAGQRYARAILEMLRGRIEGNVPILFDDATTLSVVRARLASTSPAEVCASLSLLEKAGAPDLIDTLVAHVTHPVAEVRLYALERLLELKPAALREVRRRLSADPAPSVRGAAVRALGADRGAATTEEVVPYLDDAEPIVRRSAVAVLFAMKDDKAHATASAAIERFATSTRTVDRVLAAQLADEHGFDVLLQTLGTDGDPRVRRAALAASEGASSMRSTLFDALSDPRLAQTAAKTIAAHGADVLREIAARFRPGTDRRVLGWLAHITALIGGEKAIALLRAHADFPDATVRGDVLAALDRLGWVTEGAEREALIARVRDEAREAAWTLGAIRDLAGEPTLGSLVDALEGDVAEAGRRAYYELASFHDRVAIQRAKTHVAHPSKTKRAYALEVLDLELDSDERDVVLPLIDDDRWDSRLRRLAPHFPQPTRAPDDRIRDILARDDRWLRPWTRSLALRAAAVRDLRALTEKEKASMLLIERIILLKTVQMFAASREDLIAEIASILEEVECKKDAVVLTKGDAGDSMYIVVSGGVRVFDGDRTLSRLGPKEIFGELALLDPEPRSASVAATEDTLLFRLDSDTFSQLMAGNLEIVRGVLHVLCERLRRTSAVAPTGGL